MKYNDALNDTCIDDWNKTGASLLKQPSGKEGKNESENRGWVNNGGRNWS
jgi:hypothetical protein